MTRRCIKALEREANANTPRPDRRLDKTVAAAKAAGATWGADIGKAVGVNRQAAHQRWSNLNQD